MKHEAKLFNFRLVSTAVHADAENGKPKVINAYNKYMGGVDSADMMASFYGDNRKSLKVWKKVVIHIIHRVLLNAYIIYSQHTTDRPVMSRLRFNQRVVEELSEQHVAENRRNVFPGQVRRIRTPVVVQRLPGEFPYLQYTRSLRRIE
ncbi:MAG: hypothetical protein ABW185_08545 [Sedimenticola sp.]